MKKTLVIITHPDLSASVVNKRWTEALGKHPARFTLHDLYGRYPSAVIDVAREQALVEDHDKIIFQFPFYWFSCPPLLKQWLDEVLIHGWAYGSKSGYKLRSKKIALAITAGIDEREYRAGEKYKYTLEQLTAPFELTFNYVEANYAGLFAFYGMEYHASEDRIQRSVSEYVAFATSF